MARGIFYIRYATSYALRALLIAMLLPIWSAYYFGSLCITGE